MGNPYLERQAAKGTNSHGKVSEKRVAKAIGARLQPNSGAMAGAKSDAILAEAKFRLEMKSTQKDVIGLHVGWLAKISQEAVTHGQYPGVVCSFVRPDGTPQSRLHSEWIAIPLEVFRALLTR